MSQARDAVEASRTLRDILRWSVSRLAQAEVRPGHGTLSLLDEALTLALWVLHLPPDEYERWLDARLARQELQAVADIIEERCRSRIPAAYLTGEAWLAGLCFRCDPRALVPRSLIAESLDTSLDEYLEHYPRAATWPRSVLDLCAGGGSLAILAALRFPDARIVASDLSQSALDLARENTLLHGVEARVALTCGDLLEPVNGEMFDLIICNPPYVCDESMARLPAEFRSEPQSALAGGPDGMDLVRRILADAGKHLNDEGVILIEIGHEADHFERAFPALDFIYLPVTAGDRMLVLIEGSELRARPAGRAARRRKQ